MQHFWIWYLAAVNLLGLVLMGADKYRAQEGLWRVPERTLFIAALIGGAAGSLLGMLLFNHKTRHWYFMLGMPLILAVQLVAALLIHG
ncbi:MAG: DUF1294 domain-containing protein [Oscillospiraceae bacterium]|nr:DUF1294 domain-containing protein [Oscillospiraceae bacterium]